MDILTVSFFMKTTAAATAATKPQDYIQARQEYQ